MSGQIRYPNLPQGSVPEELRRELRKLVDQMNMELAELEHRIHVSEQGGNANGNR